MLLPQRRGDPRLARLRPRARAAERAKALGDPTRLAVALALRKGGELCVCDLARIPGRAENLVSDHLRLLRGAGLAGSRRDGKMVLYSLSGEGASCSSS